MSDDLFQPSQPMRLPDGRFIGRPVGRKRGRRNDRTILIEGMFENESAEITRAVINAAKAGDMAAAKIVLERIAPKPRGRPVVWEDAPEIDVATSAGRAMMLAAIVSAAIRGEISPEDAQSLAANLEIIRRNEETESIAADVAAIKERLGIDVTP